MLVSGSFLIFFGGLGFWLVFMQDQPDKAGLALFSILMLGGGNALLVVDRRRKRNRRRAETMALQMLRDGGQIDILRLSQMLEMEAGDAKRLVLELQREGVIAYDAKTL